MTNEMVDALKKMEVDAPQGDTKAARRFGRSEEHTSELQSH